jgi:hypothetical protein
MDFETELLLISTIDESAFCKRKYRKGRILPTKWFFMAIERASHRCFVIHVENCIAETLLHILETHVLPGSRIISAGWQAYNSISDIKNGVFCMMWYYIRKILRIPLIEMFIEALWSHLKRRLIFQIGMYDTLFC